MHQSLVAEAVVAEEAEEAKKVAVAEIKGDILAIS